MLGFASAHGSSDAYGESSFEGSSTIVSEALEPIYEWFSTQTESLEEQRYRFKTRLTFTQPRHAYFAVGHRGTIGFRSRDVDDILEIPDIEERFVRDLQARTSWISLDAPAAALLEHPRMQPFLETTKAAEPDEPEDWFEAVE